jgi:hypothetical protein
MLGKSQREIETAAIADTEADEAAVSGATA